MEIRTSPLGLPIGFQQWPDLGISRHLSGAFLNITGEGARRVLVEGAILQGFKLTALACFVLCIVAAFLAFFTRTRLLEKGSIELPVQKEEQGMSVSPYAQWVVYCSGTQYNRIWGCFHCISLRSSKTFCKGVVSLDEK